MALSISLLVYVIVGQYVFGFQLGWFPVQGWSDSVVQNLLQYAPLPVLLAVLVGVLVGVSPQTRLYRSFFLDALGHDYVRTARAKGLTEPVVLFKHVLHNAMIPILTNVGLALPGIFVGSFLVEAFFSIPGLGREVLLAVNRSDYPVIQAATVYLAMITMGINLATGLVASQWQRELALPNAPPTLLSARAGEDAGTMAGAECLPAPKVDLSDIDPLAPRYAESAARAARLQTTETVKADTLPLGADRLGRDVLAKAIKGAECRSSSGCWQPCWPR